MDPDSAAPRMLENIRSQEMRFNIYGRFQVDVRRENECWSVYRSELGKRVRMNDIVVPSNLEANEIAIYLDDIFHELAGLGQRVEILAG
jgi:hypothetical protein